MKDVIEETVKGCRAKVASVEASKRAEFVRNLVREDAAEEGIPDTSIEAFLEEVSDEDIMEIIDFVLKEEERE